MFLFEPFNSIQIEANKDATMFTSWLVVAFQVIKMFYFILIIVTPLIPTFANTYNNQLMYHYFIPLMLTEVVYLTYLMGRNNGLLVLFTILNLWSLFTLSYFLSESQRFKDNWEVLNNNDGSALSFTLTNPQMTIKATNPNNTTTGIYWTLFVSAVLGVVLNCLYIIMSFIEFPSLFMDGGSRPLRYFFGWRKMFPKLFCLRFFGLLAMIFGLLQSFIGFGAVVFTGGILFSEVSNPNLLLILILGYVCFKPFRNAKIAHQVRNIKLIDKTKELDIVERQEEVYYEKELHRVFLEEMGMVGNYEENMGGNERNAYLYSDGSWAEFSICVVLMLLGMFFSIWSEIFTYSLHGAQGFTSGSTCFNLDIYANVIKDSSTVVSGDGYYQGQVLQYGPVVGGNEFVGLNVASSTCWNETANWLLIGTSMVIFGLYCSLEVEKMKFQSKWYGKHGTKIGKQQFEYGSLSLNPGQEADDHWRMLRNLRKFSTGEGAPLRG